VIYRCIATLIKLLEENETLRKRPASTAASGCATSSPHRDRHRQESARLANMTRQAVEDGLYDVPAEAHTHALRRGPRRSEPARSGRLRRTARRLRYGRRSQTRACPWRPQHASATGLQRYLKARLIGALILADA
jgi:hypothetical protein